ncbi:histidine kinase [Arenibacter sp. H213]|uniref:Histidine kinase n=2 Tax=Flavobacteriaceae TaxID=49546 RepID=A0ABW5VB92_9FLAO|nr:histidine kinase [Arenibacter sp. H213]
MHLSGQIMADVIPVKINLVGNKNVKALKSDRKGTFEDIKRQTAWKPYDSAIEATIETSIWLKFEIENQSQNTVKVYLNSPYDYTTIHRQIGQDYIKLRNGSYIPLPERANESDRSFTELIFIPFQKSLLYIRLDFHNSKPRDTPVIYSERGYWNASTSNYKSQTYTIAFIYFYIISLITIFIFAFVFRLRLRKKLYLYYLGYLFFQLVYGLLVLRNTMAPIGNYFEYNPSLAFDLLEPIQFIFIGFYIFFILQLLTVKTYDKLLAKILFYLGLFCFLYALTNFAFSYFLLNGKYTDQIFYIVRYIILPTNFILIFWIIYKVKHPLLIYFIVGQSFFFIGALLSTYVAYSEINLIPDHLFNFKEAPNIIFQIGLLAEVYCFSLALGKNVYLLQKEKERANTALINQLQENQYLQETMNRELDGKVQEKTSELIQLYSEIERERNQKNIDNFNKKLKETEMVALRSQMNPHFIFNSMNAIKNLIMTSRNDDAITYLDDFASLLRGILQNSNRKKITVEEELGVLELYLSLEQSRMGKNFNYTIQVNSREGLSQYEIPPLLLQPIVENAIWHGLHPSLRGEKKLTIFFDTTNDLKIIIEDNGIGRKESAKKKKLHNSMGTTILQDRLTLYNHLNDHAIYYKITDLEEEDRALGTRITLTYNY